MSHNQSLAHKDFQRITMIIPSIKEKDIRL